MSSLVSYIEYINILYIVTHCTLCFVCLFACLFVAASPQPEQLTPDAPKPIKRSATISAVQSPRLKNRKQ